MSVKTEATVDDLMRVPEDGKAELVGGELILMSPTGGLPGIVSFQIAASLNEYARRTGTGYAFPDNVGFLVDLPNRRSFSPDAAFHPGPVTMSFLLGAPTFAVEVRSEGDYGPAAKRAMAAKRADYFAAGTLAVWDVDLDAAEDEPVVRCYRPETPESPVEFRRGEVARAEPVLPGWSMAVDDLWPFVM